MNKKGGFSIKDGFKIGLGITLGSVLIGIIIGILLIAFSLGLVGFLSLAVISAFICLFVVLYYEFKKSFSR